MDAAEFDKKKKDQKVADGSDNRASSSKRPSGKRSSSNSASHSPRSSRQSQVRQERPLLEEGDTDLSDYEDAKAGEDWDVIPESGPDHTVRTSSNVSILQTTHIYLPRTATSSFAAPPTSSPVPGTPPSQKAPRPSQKSAQHPSPTHPRSRTPVSRKQAAPSAARSHPPQTRAPCPSQNGP